MTTSMAARPPPSANSLPTSLASAGAPNQTLYVKNLNEAISSEDLRRELYLLFSPYGPILDIVTHRKSAKGKNMRGQAHVCFRDIQTSTQAMRGLQEYEFLGKELKISYARGTSSIIGRLRGTFEIPTGAAPESTGTGTELQRSVFGGVPSAPTGGLPAKPAVNMNGEPHGTKRPREEVDEEEKDDDNQSVEMEEDEDEDDAPMEEDDSD